MPQVPVTPTTSDRRRRIPLRALASLVVFLLAAPAGAGDGANPAGGTDADLSAIDLALAQRTVDLLNELVSGESMPEDVVRRLAGLGPEVGPCLTALRKRFSDPASVDATVEVLLRHGGAGLDEYLLGVAAEAPEEEARRKAFAYFGKHGGTQSFTPFLRPFSAALGVMKRVADDSLIAFLTRHEEQRLYDLIEAQVPKLETPVRGRVLDCIAETGSPLGFRLLARRLGRDPELEGVIVAGLARMPIIEDSFFVIPRLEALVTSADTIVRRQSIIALGRLKTPQSIAVLLDLLGSDEEPIRRNAHWSLMEISGEKFPLHTARWRIWYEEELEWWETTGQALLAVLEEGGSDGQVVGAIHALTMRPLFRFAVQPALARLAEEGSEPVRVAAASALDRFGMAAEAPPAGVLAAARGAFVDGTQPLARRPIANGTDKPPAAPPGARWPLLLVGGILIGFLLWRVTGGIAGLRAAWKRDDWGKRTDGPAVVKLKPKGRRATPPRDR